MKKNKQVLNVLRIVGVVIAISAIIATIFQTKSTSKVVAADKIWCYRIQNDVCEEKELGAGNCNDTEWFDGRCEVGPSGSTGTSGPTGSTGETGPSGATGTSGEEPTITPTPTEVPKGDGFGLPGDGLSDGRSSCPDCTKAPSSTEGQVLGASTDFAGTGTAVDMFVNAIGAMGGLSTAAGLAMIGKKKS